MECKLCRTEKGKLCKAHIVPEAFHRAMYPNLKVEGESLVMLSSDNDKKGRSWIGVYDDSILCSECDNRIGIWDKYGADIFLNSTPNIIQSLGSDTVLTFENADAIPLKLFLLSILWRASISNRPEFKNVSLPDHIERKLFNMIINSDPGELDDLSVIITQYHYVYPEKNYNKFLLLPVHRRMEGLNSYYFILPNGYKIIIKTDSRPLPESIRAFALVKGQPVYILKTEYFEQSKDYKKVLEKVKSIANL